MEKSRRVVHEEDIKLRDAAQAEEMAQVSSLKKDFYDHCRKNEISDKAMNDKVDILLEKIESLLWLNDEDTKPIIKQTVIDSRGKTWLSIQVAYWIKWIMAIGAVLTAVWLSIQISEHWEK
jgi:hypothetical protein